MKKSRIAVIVLAGVVAIVIFFMQREFLSDNLNLNSIEKEVLSKRTKAYKGKNTDDFLSVSKSDFGENIKEYVKEMYQELPVDVKMKIYGINDETGILQHFRPRNIEDVIYCYRLFCQAAGNTDNIIGVDRLYLAPWANHY